MWLRKLIARLIPPIDARIQPLTHELIEQRYERERRELEVQLQHVFESVSVMRRKATQRDP